MRISWVWVSLCLSSFIAAPAYPRGAISSGGGNGVVTSAGTFRFLDMVSDDSLVDLDSPDGLLSGVFAAPRCQSDPLTKTDIDLKFVSIFWQRIQRYDFRLGVALEFAIRRVVKRAFAVNFDLRPMGVFSDSERTDREFQVPVGAYGGNFLLVNRQLYGMLSQRDQAAFLVHEGIREYATMFGLEDDPISLADLEVATRLILDAPNSPEISDLLKSSQMLTTTRFYIVFGNGEEKRTAEEALWYLETFEGEPDLKPELLPMLMTSIMQLEEMRRRAQDNPEDKKLVDELMQINESLMSFAQEHYRPGVDVAFRLKMLELDKSFILKDDSDKKWVFDTRDILWREATDPDCTR